MVTFEGCIIYLNLLLLGSPYWPCREAADSGTEGLRASGPGVGSQGGGGIGAGVQ